MVAAPMTKSVPPTIKLASAEKHIPPSIPIDLVDEDTDWVLAIFNTLAELAQESPAINCYLSGQPDLAGLIDLSEMTVEANK
jgi:hypothetical protein